MLGTNNRSLLLLLSLLRVILFAMILL